MAVMARENSSVEAIEEEKQQQRHAQQMQKIVAMIWKQSQKKILRRLTILEHAVVALRESCLHEEQRQRAEQEAHKLAGLVGTFGFDRGSVLAREVELLLQTATARDETLALHIASLVSVLRQDLEGEHDENV
jgi:HPt (histidine-containing phosphotransfer) domain-containing protein